MFTEAVFHKMKPVKAGESFISLVLNLGTSSLGDRELCNERMVNTSACGICNKSLIVICGG